MFWVKHHPQTDKRRAKPVRDAIGTILLHQFLVGILWELDAIQHVDVSLEYQLWLPLI